MVEYIDEVGKGDPHVRSTGSTYSNAARSAFVALITRHDLENITIRGVEHRYMHPEGPGRGIAVRYTQYDEEPENVDVEPRMKTIMGDATPLNSAGEAIEPEDAIAEWEVEIVDIFRH